MRHILIEVIVLQNSKSIMRKLIHIIFIITVIILMNVAISANGNEIDNDYEPNVEPQNAVLSINAPPISSPNKTSLFPDNSTEISNRDEMIGRLYIPEVSINVALFDTSEITAKERQYVVDLPDSAAVFYLGAQCVIGDHDLQGFQNIRDVIQDQTVAYIQKGNYTDVYICTEIGGGCNTGKTIIDKNGDVIESRNDADLIMYTCNGNWQNITYTVWKEISAKDALILKWRNMLCEELV